MNATLADRRAKDAMERGAREEQIQRQKSAQILGRQRAALGANGVDLGFGSILDLQIDSAAEAEMDALTIRQNSAREAYDFQVQGVSSRAEATLARSNAKAAKTGSYLAAAGTILGGGADAFGDWQRPKIRGT